MAQYKILRNALAVVIPSDIFFAIAFWARLKYGKMRTF